MKNAGWFWLIVIFVVGYLVGVKFPATGQQVLSKIPGQVAA